MKLYFTTQPEAQKWCDDMHGKLVAARPEYADSVAKGLTKRWHIPTQDLDSKGVPVSTDWYTVSDERSDSSLTPAEKQALKPDSFIKPMPAQITPI